MLADVAVTPRLSDQLNLKLAAWASGLLLELKGDPPCSKADHEFERGGQLGPGGDRGHLFGENFPAGVIRVAGARLAWRQNLAPVAL